MRELEIFSETSTWGSSPLLDTHSQTMAAVVKKMLARHNLDYTSPHFAKELSQKVPIVHTELPEHTPGAFALYLLCQAPKNFDLTPFLSEMSTRWLVPNVQAALLSMKHLIFSFVGQPKTRFFVSEILTLIEDERTLHKVAQHIEPLAQEIALGASSSHHAKHILVTKALTQEHKTSLIHKTIVELTSRKLKPIGQELFYEMHRFLLASDDEFKRIRDVQHMCRIICYHNWFRSLLRKHKSQERSDARRFLAKPIRTTLRFQFGQKSVLGLVIAVNFLRKYEQFEARHIVSACQMLIADIACVPHSFFFYQHPSDPIQFFYLEIEKRDGSRFPTEALQRLKKSLPQALEISIEELAHKLFMPQNEEEIMRNILRLSQEIRYVKDIPHMIIMFQGQSESKLRFHVTLLRVLRDEATPLLEELFAPHAELATFVAASKKVIGYVRNKYPKEANTFVLECQKSAFLRQDHSVDLSRAREFISAIIRRALGSVRDFNGGLISQQNQLLAELKELLTDADSKYELYVDNLFHGIQPMIMRSLLSPEVLKVLFHLLLCLRKSQPKDCVPRFLEEVSGDALCLVACVGDEAIFDGLHKHLHMLDCKEQELAYTSIVIDGCAYFGYILIGQEKHAKFKELFDKMMAQYLSQRTPAPVLRISLPRPTSLLDPRIGTDRTSGIVIKMLYEGLMRVDEMGKPRPAIAASVQISPDQRTYTFTLRETKWSNGKPLTAYDFEYAWKKILDPSFHTLFAYLFYPITNARFVKKGRVAIDQLGVAALDEKTLKVHLEYPAPYFLELTAHWIYSPLCKEIDMLHPGWAYYGDETYVCNGPFRLAKWRRNTEIQALKNTNYWDAASVRLRQIDISIVEDPHRALSLYQRGDLDWIGEPLSEIPQEAMKTKHFDGKIASHPIAAVHWYALNVRQPPLGSQKCRRALAIALSRKTLIEELLGGEETPAFSILPPGLSFKKEPAFPDGDAQLASILFEEGLAEQKLTLKDIPPLVISCADQEIRRALANHVAKQWKSTLGIDVHVEVIKWDKLAEICAQRRFHIHGSTWYSWVNDPSYNLECLKDSNHEMNETQWHNQEFTRLMEEAEQSICQERRMALIGQAEAIVMEEMPIIPVFYYTFKYMKKDSVNKIYLSHLGQIDFKWTEIV